MMTLLLLLLTLSLTVTPWRCSQTKTLHCYQGKKLLCVKAVVKMSSALEKEGCLLLLRTQFLAAFFNTHAHTHTKARRVLILVDGRRNT